MRTGLKIVPVVAMSLLLLLPATIALAEETIEQYRGFAIAMGSAATGMKSTVDVGIFRWSTDEERANFLNILKEKGPEALNAAMFDAPQVAFLKVSGSMGYKLRLAREIKGADGKRHLIFAADRPIVFGGSTRRTSDYEFSFVELLVDENGKGEGALALGVAVGWDKAKDTLALETYSSEPMRIMNVTKVK